MKKIISLLAFLPMVASANSLQFTPTGNNFGFSGYGILPDTTGARNIGQFGSFSTIGPGSGTLTFTFLGQESGFLNNLSLTVGSAVQTLSEGVLGSSISAVIDGAGLIDFSFFSAKPSGTFGQFNNGDTAGSTLGFAVLKEFISNPDSAAVAGAGYNNSSTLGDFDFLLGFNDSSKGDADYDDLVVGVSFKPNVVPLPSALPLLLTTVGLFGLGVYRKRI
ncbi:MAG TPA: hypothetical protein PLR90_03105 [Methylophilus sp.]|nr:hypothetical protein [Methylophilus sp.]HQQ32884.1 hypothetical protein [Methylophilus sp.]